MASFNKAFTDNENTFNSVEDEIKTGKVVENVEHTSNTDPPSYEDTLQSEEENVKTNSHGHVNEGLDTTDIEKNTNEEEFSIENCKQQGVGNVTARNIKRKCVSGKEGGDFQRGEAKRMVRNAMMVGVVFMLHFTASLGTTHLQSSVNAAQGLGTSALAAQYVGLFLSSLLLCVFVISFLGCKWTIITAIICHMPYIASQMYPRVYTLVPAALLMGLSAAPLWSAKCTYLCVIAEAHNQLTGTDLKTIRDKVIGIFFMIFLMSMVWGNLVSSVVLSVGEETVSNYSSINQCGVHFCQVSASATTNPNLVRPSEDKINVIIGVYLGCMVLACLVGAFGVDSLKRYKEGERANSASGKSTLRLLTVTMELHRQKEMLLMIPLSIWLGVDYAFVEAEYTASFVACAWGIRNIGYVIICYGLANSGLALITGWIVSHAGRRPVLCTAAALHAILLLCLFAWTPNSEHSVVFFVVAALLGAADGHWCVQINSLYAILFPNNEEAAYSNFRLWQSVGFIIAFSYSHYLCTAFKVYIVVGLLVLGVAGYMVIEFYRSHIRTTSR